MAEALAQHMSAPCVPEFARYFVAHLGRPYEYADLRTISRGQQAWEQWHISTAPPILVCDTDWTVLHIWEHYRFGAPANGIWEWKEGYSDPQPADLYLLCTPDFDWQPDPLREHPEERHILFDWYKRLLQETEAPYAILAGSHEQRLRTALAEVKKLS